MTSFDEELYLSAALREAIENRARGDAGNGKWFASVQREDRSLVSFLGPNSKLPLEWQRVFGTDVLRRLNAECGHHGAWVVFWTHPRARNVITLGDASYDRWHMVWLDADGDPQFNITCEDRFEDVVKAGVDKWVQDGEDGWQGYKEMLRVIDPQPGQQFMAAKGEKRPTQH